MGNNGCLYINFPISFHIDKNFLSNKPSLDNAIETLNVETSQIMDTPDKIETASTKENERPFEKDLLKIINSNLFLSEKSQLFEIIIEGDFPKFLNHLQSDLWDDNNLHLVQNYQWGSYVFPLTIFQISCLLGHIEFVSFLLEKFDVEVNLNETIYGNTALHLAILNDKFPIVELLLKNPNTDIKIKNFDGKTPLHIVIEKSESSILECIFRMRINIDFKVKDYEGNTVYHYCAKYPNQTILNMILFYSQNINELESKKSVLFSKKNPFFEILNYQGETPIMILESTISNPCINESVRDSALQCSGILKSVKINNPNYVDTLSSLGNHTGEPSSDSTDDDVFTAFSWSPENERKSKRESFSHLSFQID